MRRFIMLVVAICILALMPTTSLAKSPAVFHVGDEVKHKGRDYRVTRVVQARECVARVAATFYSLRKKDVRPLQDFAAREDDVKMAGAMLLPGKHYQVNDEVLYAGEPCIVLAVVQQEECAEDGWSVFTTYQITPEQGQPIQVRQDENVLTLKLRK